MKRSQGLKLGVVDKWLLGSVFCKSALYEEVQDALSWYYLFLVVWKSKVQIPDLLALPWIKLGIKFRIE